MTDKVKEGHFVLDCEISWDGQGYRCSLCNTVYVPENQLNQMLIEAKEDGVKFARLKIEELASKEMRDGRHRYSDEIETILEALKAEKDNHADQ